MRDHLEAVSLLAAANAGAFDGADLVRAAGVWHDLGKYHPEFQRYLLESEAGTRARATGPDHKGAGTVVASRFCDPLAFLIAGHHGGLTDRSELLEKIAEWGKSEVSLEALRRAPSDLRQTPGELAIPHWVHSEHDAEFFLRMLFSALVDADYLDTERHFQVGHTRVRGEMASVEELWARFREHHENLPARDDAVSRVRTEVYEACLECSRSEPGLFRLTVPTGGGKTLSAMGFALRHALLHGMDRVIVAVPYTTITEQTAGVYRQAFGLDRVVLEHHSAIDPTRLDDQTADGLWARLASENWSAPIIVTTTVQLFESLFARSTSKCRKLHQLAGSVIILDEAQALPAHLLDPILDTLRTLTAHYRASVILCTATQPALDEAPGFKGLTNVREIAPDPPRLFAALRRVRYELPSNDESWDWERVAEEIRSEPQALAVTNTIGDAMALHDVLDDQDAFYLSTRLCGAHRRRVLEEVRRRLGAGGPCRLVSTQVVEAGVDVDFPLVLRALGPLDRIVQAAGRCNREGRLPSGRTVVFRPAEGSLPQGGYRTGTELTAMLLREADVDLHRPGLYHQYFRQLFDYLELDSQDIQELRRMLRYEEVAKRFRMIEEDTQSVVVEYDATAAKLLSEARSARFLSRELFRGLQPYTVSVSRGRMQKYREKGMVEEVRDGLLRWAGDYDKRRGITGDIGVLIA